MAKYETTKSNKLKQSAKDMEKLQTNQKNEKGTFERNKVEQQKKSCETTKYHFDKGTKNTRKRTSQSTKRF